MAGSGISLICRQGVPPSGGLLAFQWQDRLKPGLHTVVFSTGKDERLVSNNRLVAQSKRVDIGSAHFMPGELTHKQENALVEMDRLLDSLARVMEPQQVGRWMRTPNPAFDGSTPMQVVERGEMDRLWRMLYDVESGQPG